MVAERPLPAGTRVTLQGAALGFVSTSGREQLRIDGEVTPMFIDRSALSVVVPPEPQWQVGDAIRIDERTMLRQAAVGGHGWYGAIADIDYYSDEFVSRAWSEGRVQVLWPQADQGARDE